MTWAGLGAGTQEVKIAEVKTGTWSTQHLKSCRWQQVPEQKAASLPAGAGEPFKVRKLSGF